MNLNKMTLREQILVAVAVAIIVGGAYGVFRYYPVNKNIVQLQADAQALDKAVKAGKIPEEPFEDAEDLKLDLAELEGDLEDATNMVKGAEQKLSPLDTTDVRLEISEVARRALVRINANEEYRVAQSNARTAAGATAVTGDLKGKAARIARKQAQRAARAQSLARRGGGGLGSGQAITNASADQVTPLVRKMAVGTPLERPMQRLTMEGTYAGLMRFIQSLDDMSKMATVVQLSLQPTASKNPPPGYNQRITAVMILAL